MGKKSRSRYWLRAGRIAIPTLCMLIGLLGAIGCASQEAMAKRGAQNESQTARTQSETADDHASNGDQTDPKLDITAPAIGYLEARKHLLEPMELLGGAIQVRISQDSGAAHAALPDHRQLDPRVFGDSTQPRAFAGSPIIYGVPSELREYNDSGFAALSTKSAFGGKTMTMPKARMKLEAFDRTATDAVSTGDSVRFLSLWHDSAGNSYSVRCDRVMPFGVQYPVFGGVVTNHIMYGFSRIGTPLMPTEFVYVAFWGEGQVLKNDSIIDDSVTVHGMLTEYVRTKEYDLAFDHEVNPRKRQFHLMVLPYSPKEYRFEKSSVNTGFVLPDGKELPFWHLTFGNLDIRSRRLAKYARSTETDQYPLGGPGGKKGMKDEDKPRGAETEADEADTKEGDTAQPADTVSPDTTSSDEQPNESGRKGDLIPEDTIWSGEKTPSDTTGETAPDSIEADDSDRRSEEDTTDNPGPETDGASGDTLGMDDSGQSEADTIAAAQNDQSSAPASSSEIDSVGRTADSVASASQGAGGMENQSAPEGSVNNSTDSVEQDSQAQIDSADGEKEAAKKPDETIRITRKFKFKPNKVTIRAGQTVRWRNDSRTVHTVTLDSRLVSDPENVSMPPDAKPFHSGNLIPKATFDHTFDVPGEYTYFCIPHEEAGMVAKVIVKPNEQD